MTPERMVDVITRLARFYAGRGGIRLDRETLESHAEEFSRKLRRFRPDQIEDAVTGHIDNSPYYPTPDQILTRCLDLERSEAEHEARALRRARVDWRAPGPDMQRVGEIMADLAKQMGIPMGEEPTAGATEPDVQADVDGTVATVPPNGSQL